MPVSETYGAATFVRRRMNVLFGAVDARFRSQALNGPFSAVETLLLAIKCLLESA